MASPGMQNSSDCRVKSSHSSSKDDRKPGEQPNPSDKAKSSPTPKKGAGKDGKEKSSEERKRSPSKSKTNMKAKETRQFSPQTKPNQDSKTEAVVAKEPPRNPTKERKDPIESKSNSDQLTPENEQHVENPSNDETNIQCVICLETCTQPKTLHKCGHIFCTECIDQYFQSGKPQCPCCFTIYGEMRGNQPENGKMQHIITHHILPGFSKSKTKGTIKITYTIPDGIQDERHPHPGKPYHGTVRDAYLPNNPEGQYVLKLLQKAFELRQIFTIGQSRTSGRDDVVTWNDIHHKTYHTGGPENFAYPDPTYLERVKHELAAKGIE